ncbi:MAG: NAD(P)-binding domain-containing protein [Rubricoccaceae bacterium]|nr:NAD(P)-binding domain-containing protein [Rubricoccaceae bacterium]
MNIGIIGSGNVGRALGKGFVSRGHSVHLGTRDPNREELQQWASEGGDNATVSTNEDAAAFGELIVLATDWSGTENAIQLAGVSNFSGKVVIDVTNPLDFSQGGAALAIGHTDSAGEQIQRWLPDAYVVKAFNSVTAALMVDPDISGGPPTMFIAGDHPAARSRVTEICRDFGWEVVDIGPMTGARYLEPLAMVYIVHAFDTGNWMQAFKLLKK